MILQVPSRERKNISHLLTQPSWTLKKKFERLIFPTKYVIPKSLKFSHWPSKYVKKSPTGPTERTHLWNHWFGTLRLHQSRFIQGTSQSLEPSKPLKGKEENHRLKVVPLGGEHHHLRLRFLVGLPAPRKCSKSLPSVRTRYQEGLCKTSYK